MDSVIDSVYKGKQEMILSENAGFSMSKRIMDIMITLMLLPVVIPVLAAAMLLIRLDSSGTPLFIQKRGGEGGQRFKIYKLRTLYHDPSDDGSQQVIKRDKRVTRIGKYLRRFHIDELPQLYNILKGDMSLVGPRPHSASMDQYYHERIPHYMTRYHTRPGITGLAQVNGSNGVIHQLSDMEQRIAYDLKYIEKQSLFLDWMIIIQTIMVVFRLR